MCTENINNNSNNITHKISIIYNIEVGANEKSASAIKPSFSCNFSSIFFPLHACTTRVRRMETCIIEVHMYVFILNYYRVENVKNSFFLCKKKRIRGKAYNFLL